MNKNQTEPKPQDVEEFRKEGLHATACSPSSDTPETDAALVDHMPEPEEWSQCYLDLAIHARKMERERNTLLRAAGSVRERLYELPEALHAGNCPKSFEEWWNDHENGCPTLVLDNDEQFARAVWNAAVNAATILIAAKGRHNTILAYEGLHDTLQSTNPKEL